MCIFSFILYKKLIKYRIPGAIGSIIINILALLGAIACNVVEEKDYTFAVIAVALVNALSFVVVRGHRIFLNMDTDWVSLSEIFKMIAVLFKASVIISVVYVIIGCYAGFLEILFVGTGIIFILIGEQIYIDFLKKRD